MLRGEALPVSHDELRHLRDQMDRHYGEEVVPTGSGPLLVVRVPHGEPEFLRDLEAAVDVLPYRDLQGFRSIVLLGDRAHMGVSADMLRALMEGRRQSEADWVARLRTSLGPWTFSVTRMPSDPERRLRAAFRVDTDSVQDLDEDQFVRLAEMLPDVKAASPGRVRPAIAYLVAHADHVRLDGAAFFTDLEKRHRRANARANDRVRRELEERHAVALAHLERITGEPQFGRPAPRDRAAPARSERRRAVPPPAGPPASGRPRMPPPPVDVPRATDRTRRDGPTAPPSRAAAARPPAPADIARNFDDRLPRAPRAPRAPLEPRASPDAFAAANRHPESIARIRHGLDAAGYKTKERLIVHDVPVILAAARPEGYPTRVLVTFHEELTADTAMSLVQMARGVSAELVVAVADRVAAGTDRVTLATNVKVIPPDAVPDLRFQ